MQFTDLTDLKFDEDNQLVSESDKTEVLNRLSDEIILQNLKDQFEKPYANDINSIDFLELFDNRFAVLLDRYSENEEMAQTLKDVRLELYTNTCRDIENKFSIQTNLDPYNMDQSSYFYYVKKLYNFFILNHKENIVSFFVNYIFNNREEISKQYKKGTNKRDLEVSSLRKMLKELDDVVIIFNLQEIIDEVSENLNDNETILKEIIENDPEELTNAIISELFIDNLYNSFLQPDFYKKLFRYMKENRHEFIPEIRNSLITLLPRK